MNRQVGKFLKTKIVCTFGPSSTDRATLDAMARAGMDVVRLNMSHSVPDQARAASAAIRACAAEVGKPIAVMLDLQGAKIRVGQLAKPKQLETGERVALVPQEEAAGGEIPITYVGLAADLEPGNRVLLSDGQIELLVRGTSGMKRI
jgi:pyruvate kinase